ncbi:DUF4956 domain-containing protein [Naasia lichenicola]|uniref:DUF4956 domain-containing protein n=1 Tax=Naasia lichenicola TaxID=2565933 RepID=A0A4S4FS74_9MICO|nr:DUF4956 domain-containing protein [Naasia lichenicola]THG33523.1 DUF4956 domain-containing protein [Naasia lichenicola]
MTAELTATLIMIALDLIAIAGLTSLYFHRHRRRDLVVAFLGVNIGVLAVSQVLATTEVGLGIGLGLFGVLSIIRLRSSEISQREVAYYFSALAIGLIAGLAPLGWEAAALIALIAVVMAVGDSPALLSRYRHQTMRIDRAIPDEGELRAVLESMLGGTVKSMIVQNVDLVDDTTVVDVRFRVGGAPSTPLDDRLPAGQRSAGALR